MDYLIVGLDQQSLIFGPTDLGNLIHRPPREQNNAPMPISEINFYVVEKDKEPEFIEKVELETPPEQSPPNYP